MTITELLLAQFEREAALSRKVLANVPEGKDDWKPHEKSMALGYLAQLVASMPGWADFMINQDSYDIITHKEPPTPTREALLNHLDNSLKKAIEAFKNTNDEHLMKEWKLLVGGHEVSSQPRYIALQEAVINHMAHHRGQLTVYLRLNDEKVPCVYGPTADDQGF